MSIFAPKKCSNKCIDNIRPPKSRLERSGKRPPVRDLAFVAVIPSVIGLSDDLAEGVEGDGAKTVPPASGERRVVARKGARSPYPHGAVQRVTFSFA